MFREAGVSAKSVILFLFCRGPGQSPQSLPHKSRCNKLAGINQIPEELIHAGGATLCSETHNLNNSVRDMEELPQLSK